MSLKTTIYPGLNTRTRELRIYKKLPGQHSLIRQIVLFPLELVAECARFIHIDSNVGDIESIRHPAQQFPRNLGKQ